MAILLLSQSSFTVLCLSIIIVAGQCDFKVQALAIPNESTVPAAPESTSQVPETTTTAALFPGNSSITNSSSSNFFTQLFDKGYDPRFLSEKEYYISSIIRGNWYNAGRFCAFYGMQLATINTPEEYDQIKRGINRLGFGYHNFWLSGTDQGQETNYFFWSTTGRALSFTDWGYGEPNNWQQSEHCLELVKYGGYYWNDRNCLDENYFICEKSYNFITRLS